MAKTYRLSGGRKLANALMSGMLRIGVAPKTTSLLTVRGRRSGEPHSMPVNPVTDGSRRWLVAPYGEVAWVHNVRAAKQVTLSRGRHSETLRAVEVSSEAAAPVLKRYVAGVAITRPYFDAGPDDPIERFVAEASRHPVFELLEPARG